VLDLVAREELAFAGLAARIADLSGRAAGKRDGTMSRELKPAKHQLPHEMPDVKAVSCGIEAAVERDWLSRGVLGELGTVSAIGDQAAQVEFFQDRHCAKVNCQ